MDLDDVHTLAKASVAAQALAKLRKSYDFLLIEHRPEHSLVKSAAKEVQLAESQSSQHAKLKDIQQINQAQLKL
eukprot:2732907-Karenia_brevis.AAC.1